MGEHVNAAPPPQGPEPVDQLIRAGCESYLDALYALHRFKREVIDTAREVWVANLAHLAEAIGMESPPAEYVERYCNPDGVDKVRDGNWDGNWAWVTCRSWFPHPFRAHCHLGLSFERGQNGQVPCQVQFMIVPEQANVRNILRATFQGAANFWHDEDWSYECGFSWPLGDIAELTRAALREQFSRMMEHAIRTLRCEIAAMFDPISPE